jgi:glycosyltransferase involved in cell wall biosynthesis
MEELKIAYITPRHPWPPNKGDQLIAYNQIKRLSKDNDIYLFTFPTEEKSGDVLGFENLCKEVHHINISKPLMFFNALKTIVNGKPLQVNMFTRKSEMEKVQEAMVRIVPDIIHVQTVRMAEYGIMKVKHISDDDFQSKAFLDMIDLLSLNMKRRADKEIGFKRWIMNMEGRLLEDYERNIAMEYDRTVFVSDYDAKKSNLENKAVNPNGTYISREIIRGYDIKKKKQILFHGNMNYFPNAEAAIYFAERIWPQIREKHPDYKYIIAGRNPGKRIRNLHNGNDIIVKSNVRDMVEILLESEIGVYLMNSGTGLQNKILEALAAGLPVVATPMALNGIPGIDDETVMTVDGDREIIEAVDRLIRDPELRSNMSIKGVEFMEERFTWESNVERLKSIWKDGQ